MTKCTPIEGGFNRAFILHLDNGTSLVVRIPFSIAGPRRLTTNSEEATMEYVRRNTSIPVPAVLDWSDDPTNPVGSEYIIMEHAAGVQLHQRWPSMTSQEHMLAVKALAQITKELSCLELPAYGSLYFSNAPVEPSRLIAVSADFCVGPHCGNRYRPTTIGDERWYERRPPNRGPWNTHEDYCHGLVDAGISRIPPMTPPNAPEFKGSVEEHLRLACTTEQVLVRLAQSESIKSVDRPLLLHHDLHKRNVFVSANEPAKITGIIDWQSSSIEPISHYSDEVPDLCEFPDTWDEAEIEDPPTKEQQKTITDVSICRRTWEVMMRGYIPELHQARTMDQDFLRLFRYAASSWRHGAVPIREDLIHLSSHWSASLSLDGSCPYQPTESEVLRQKMLWPDFLTTQEMKSELIKGLGTDEDGWIPIDRWEETKTAYSLLFNDWLKTVVETGEMTEGKAKSLWPFDTRTT